ncbi:hypothetical protein CRENPOLYSF1_80007 [Crenothrix polyspora]|uniref:Uncharacterized protein n=1 Tax=Crenothrix polyspora TaxID=360316 RepID=A0A1R4HHW4_9GAMM|nr:hypothetical protein CRENPOLYSF1_80007 [Crenothrix polyspora]
MNTTRLTNALALVKTSILIILQLTNAQMTSLSYQGTRMSKFVLRQAQHEREWSLSCSPYSCTLLI